MNISFIKPNIGRREHSLYVDQGRMEPLMLGVLAALTPPDVEVVLHDDRMEAIPFDAPTHLAAITVETFTARRAYEIAAEYRRRGVPVILGGMHPTLLPGEAAEHADAIFLGDAETLWPRVVEDLRQGRLRPRYEAPPGVAQLGGLRPRRDLFRGKGYLPITLMQYMRGCRYACDYCAVSRYFHRRCHVRNIDEVLAEIDSQQGRWIFFVDDNIAAEPEALKDLCRAMRGMGVRWISQASLDVCRDGELMRLMADSGCLGHVMGFESINPESLRASGKIANLPGFDGYRREVAVLREHGMQTWAAFTLGYDDDTPETIQATLEFALRHRFTFAAFNLLMPYPNTPFYTRLQREGRLLYDGRWWLHPSYRFNHAAFTPRAMTPEQLTHACHDARTRFNALPALARRFMDLKTNMRTLWRAANYWRYATLFRREVNLKHGMRLGLK